MRNPNTVAYKIWNKDSNKFSVGGTIPTFSTAGKAWPDTRTLNNHLSGLEKTSYCKSIYDNCYIITLSSYPAAVTEPILVSEWNKQRGK